MHRRNWTLTDLEDRARRAMREAGFPDHVPKPVELAAERLKHDHKLPSVSSDILALQNLLWSSIDNDDSMDLDQLEYVEEHEDGVRLMVAIADVDALVENGAVVDGYAREMTTSVYTGVLTFSMLPEQLSHGITSLLPGEDRLAIVIDMHIAPSGDAELMGLSRALVRNKAKLVYEEVGSWLDGQGPLSCGTAEIPDLRKQLQLQSKTAQWLASARDRTGKLNLQTIEARPVIRDGQVTDMRATVINPARRIIENFMIAANMCIASHFSSLGLPAIQRIVVEPKRWDRIRDLASISGDYLPLKPDQRALSAFLTKRRAADPESFPDLSLSVVKLLGNGEYTVVRPGDNGGHFGLAVHNYTHSSAPNRRYPDLITQRMLKASLSGQQIPYAVKELERLANHCTEREDEANKVERLMRKSAAATMLQDRIGEAFDGIVTGASPKGTYARVFEPPFEGRIVRSERGLDVGDRVRVKLLDANPENGFIDLARY